MSTVLEPVGKSRASDYVDADAYIDYQLEKTRAGVKSTDILTASIGVVTLFLGYLLAFVLLDHWVIPGGFSPWMRVVLLSLVGGTGLVWLARRVVIPYLKRVNTLYAARVIEQHNPELRSTLLNLVDLGASGRPVSEPIRNTLQKRAAVALSHTDVDQALDRRPLMRTMYVLLAIVVIGCAYTLFTPKKISASVLRALLPLSERSVSTQTEIVDVKPGDVEILARAQVEVIVDLRGLVPERVLLFYSTADRKFVDAEVELQRIDDSGKQFRAVLSGENARGILQDTTYHIVAGDAKSREYRIAVHQPPSARADSVRYEYPDYMESAPKTEPGGTIDAWEGTMVTVTATANMPVRSATIYFSDKEDASQRAEELAMTVTEETQLRASWPLEFRIDDKSAGDEKKSFAKFYRIQVKTANGDTDPQPTFHSITIRPDKRPDVTLVDPTRDLEKPANAIVPLMVAARDDFKLRTVRVRVQKNGDDIPFDGTLLETAQPSFLTQPAFEMRLERFNVKPGDTLKYWIEARDNRSTKRNREGQITNTPVLSIKIVEPVAPQEVAKQLQDDKQKQDEKLDEIRQKANENGVEEPPADPKDERPNREQKPEQRNPPEAGDNGKPRDPRENAANNDRPEDKPGEKPERNRPDRNPPDQGEQKPQDPQAGEGQKAQGAGGQKPDGAARQGRKENGNENGNERKPGAAGEDRRNQAQDGPQQGAKEGQPQRDSKDGPQQKRDANPDEDEALNDILKYEKQQAKDRADQEKDGRDKNGGEGQRDKPGADKPSKPQQNQNDPNGAENGNDPNGGQPERGGQPPQGNDPTGQPNRDKPGEKKPGEKSNTGDKGSESDPSGSDNRTGDKTSPSKPDKSGTGEKKPGMKSTDPASKPGEDNQPGDAGDPANKSGKPETGKNEPGQTESGKPKPGDKGTSGEKTGDAGAKKPDGSSSDKSEGTRPGDPSQANKSDGTPSDPKNGTNSANKPGDKLQPGEKSHTGDKTGDKSSDPKNGGSKSETGKPDQNPGAEKPGAAKPGAEKPDGKSADGGKPAGNPGEGKPEKPAPKPSEKPDSGMPGDKDGKPGEKPDGKRGEAKKPDVNKEGDPLKTPGDKADDPKKTDESDPKKATGKAPDEGGGDKKPKNGTAGEPKNEKPMPEAPGGTKGQPGGDPKPGDDSPAKPNDPKGQSQGNKGARPEKPLEGEKTPAGNDPTARKEKGTGDEEGTATPDNDPKADPARAKKPLQREEGKDPVKRPGDPDNADPKEIDRRTERPPETARSKPGDPKDIRPEAKPGDPEEGPSDAGKPGRDDQPSNKTDDGKGQPNDKPGKPSGKPSKEAGKPGQGKPGEGDPSEGKPGEGQPTPGKPGEKKPGARQGDKPGEKSDSADAGEPGEGGKPSGKPGDGKPGDGKPGQGSPEGSQSGENSGKPGEKPRGSRANGSIGKGGDGSDDSSGDGSGAGKGTGGEAPPGDEASLEDGRKAANLVLKKLQDQLNRGEVDQNLLKELGWTEDQMRRFVSRLDKQLNDAGDDQSPTAQARRRQFEEMLKSLDLGSSARARRGAESKKPDSDAVIGPRRPPVPAEFRGRYEAYTRELSKRNQAAEK